MAAHLIARGASFLTDDVLAVEPVNGELLAHPGAGLVSIAEAEWQAMSPEGRARFGRRLGRSDKSYFAPGVEERPLPLAAVYFLGRDATPSDFRSSGVGPSTPPASSAASSWTSFVHRNI